MSPSNDCCHSARSGDKEMLFKLRGYDAKTNEDKTLTVPADNEKEAARIGREQGVHSYWIDRDVAGERKLAVQAERAIELAKLASAVRLGKEALGKRLGTGQNLPARRNVHWSGFDASREAVGE